MEISNDLKRHTVHSGMTVHFAIKKMNESGTRILFVVGERGELLGSFSDGDFRRWIASLTEINLDTSIVEAMNSQVQSIVEGATQQEMEHALGPALHAVPIVDKNEHVKRIITREKSSFSIEGREIGDSDRVFIIAEIGNNHNGSIETAQRLIDLAAKSGVDCVKFQMRDLSSLYSNSGRSADPTSDLGDQYTLDLLNRYQLNSEGILRLMDYARRSGVIPLCTPWDSNSLKILVRYGASALKIASADFTNLPFLREVSETSLPTIFSTGMCTEEEIRYSVRMLKSHGSPMALLHCNSTYPTPHSSVNLRYIRKLRDISNCVVGYSGHERGVATAIGAVALGARIVEKHFTLDRNLEGVDHKVSLLPDELTSLVRGIRELEHSLGNNEARTVTQGERMNREVLGKSIVAATNIEEGQLITEDVLKIQSPGKGLPPYRLKELLGTVSKSSKQAGSFFYESDISRRSVKARPFNFQGIRWGIPVRHHDFKALSKLSNPDLFEVHLSYEDLNLDIDTYIQEMPTKSLIVHSPELFESEHIIDLASLDEDYRTRSLREIRKVIAFTERSAEKFSQCAMPLVVVNVGGATDERHLTPTEVRSRMDALYRSLEELHPLNIELLPQTMPPFPWHFGGQRFHNLFVRPDDIVGFCNQTGMRICLDVSHSKLACNFYSLSFRDFLLQVLPHTAHMHIADAQGYDGEGLQIGEGDIDWSEFWRVLSLSGISPSFIPEIWQGHKDGGHGFWYALTKLEKIHSQNPRGTQ